MSRRPTVLLATSGDLPDGEPGAAVLDAALAERGLHAAWVRWDDPARIDAAGGQSSVESGSTGLTGRQVPAGDEEDRHDSGSSDLP